MKLSRLEVGVLATAGATAILLATDVWSGVRGPESWQWGRRPLDGAWPLFLNLLIFGLTIPYVLRLGRVWGTARNLVRVPLLARIVLLVFVQMIVLTAVEPDGLSNVPRRVLDPSFTSYHTIAGDVEDPREFLREYHRLQKRLPVHGPSQPPGRVLFFWSVNRWAEGKENFLHMIGRRLGGIPAGPPGTTDVERAGAMVAGYLLMLLGALCVVPLVMVVGGRTEPEVVGASLLLMATLPSYLLFTPQTDHLILLTSLSATALILESMRFASRRWAPAAAFAGGLFAGLGIFVSFTTLASLAAWGLGFLGMLWFARLRATPFPTVRRTLALGAAGLAGSLVVPFVAAALGMNWIAVFREATKGAHRVQVLVFERTYSTWVGWNLWDFFLFLGFPLAVVWAARLRAEIRALRDGTGSVGASSAPIEVPFAITLLVALVVLDLSGKILGETGRIWMFLMPLAVGAAAGHLAGKGNRPLIIVAGAQLVVLLTMRMFLNVPG